MRHPIISLIVSLLTTSTVYAATPQERLRAAVIYDDYSIVQSLLAARVDPTGFDPVYRNTLLHVAAERDAAMVIPALVEAGADINARGHSGWTPLIVAAHNGRLNAISTLVELRADPNVPGLSGQRALHHTAQRGDWEATSRLVAHPLIEVNVFDHIHGTPFDRAIARARFLEHWRISAEGHWITAAILAAHGAILLPGAPTALLDLATTPRAEALPIIESLLAEQRTVQEERAPFLTRLAERLALRENQRRQAEANVSAVLQPSSTICSSVVAAHSSHCASHACL